ncbi:uncharacterized protein [Chironomus tepperi]|uniref:uncharacterized protein n=1 Tax=Chironomus tepperi TaxID=113505 RepID=UPI00391F8D3A
MKFLIVLSVLVVCASAKPLFFNHPLLSGLLGGGGGSSSNAAASSSSYSAPAPPPPEPVYAPAPPPPAPVASGPAPNPLAGLHKIIMIPINIKKSLLQAHQAKFNKKIQGLLGAFQGLGSLGGGGSSSSAGASSHSISGPEPQVIPSGPAPNGGSVDYNTLGGGESSGSSSFSSSNGLSAGGNVQTYHPQPAPNTNYHSSPIVLYLYPVSDQSSSSSHASAGSNSIDFQPAPIAPAPAPIAPAPDCNQPQPAPFVPQPAPFVPQPAPFVPEPAPFIPEPVAPQQNYGPPEPVAPQQTYGPPDYQPAQPISSSYTSGTASSSSFDFEPQAVQPVPQPQNTYLPPSYKRRF